ncbi:MAG: ThuA domain-containing protein [Akkermansiaceae bacterium]|nr:ThuA domain-containing protein [Akkermansiaceae bacterium]
MRRTLLLFPLFLMTALAAEPEPRRIEVLFLGDDGHHKPLERYRVLKQALAPRGYNISWVEDLGKITRAKLDRYDALIVYANHEKDVVPADLLGWVKDGGGLVALHSACGCFHPSEEWFDMVGGRFQSHEGHVFSPETVDKEHQVTRDLPVLEAWDETYVHRDLTDDRHLLQVRPPINQGETKPEPWTWLREEGKGRVFYTASGHDLRVWTQEAYQELVARAIVWAAGPEVAASFQALKLAPLETEIPEIEGRAHPDIPMMPLQKPLSPEQSAGHIQVPAGMKLELFASEPMIVNPIAIDWDERGRCWVVEALGYPNDVPVEEGKGEDRIKILEDTDGDGRADKVTVFADKIRHGTTLVFHRGGVLVTDGPDIVYLRDDNGDDKADTRRVVASGLKIWDTHASTSNFLHGFDSWVYATSGYSGVDAQIGGKRHEFGMGVFRFRPSETQLEVLEFLQETTNNTWGLGFDEEGAVFGSTANNNPSWQVSIPRRAYENSGINPQKTPRLDDQPLMYPNTRDITQVDQIERYTAAAGHMFYNDDVMKDFIGPDDAMICEPTGHIVALGRVTENGSLHRIDLRGNNLLASSDAWVAPVAARTGPDGAVWVADWYNPIIQHNVVFRFWNPARGYDRPHSPYHTGEPGPGKGNAYVTPLRDREHGRIWRIRPMDVPLREVPVLSADDAKGCLAALASASQHVRLHAQRLLVEKADPGVIPALAEMAMADLPSGGGRPLGNYHALRTLQGLSDAGVPAAREAILPALSHGDARVRLQAMESLPAADPAVLAALPEMLKTAATPRSMLRILTVASLTVPNELVAAAIWEVAKTKIGEDGTLREAARLAMRRQATTLLGVAFTGELPGGWIDAELEEITRRISAGPNRTALESILAAAPEALRVRFSALMGEAPAQPAAEPELPAELVAGRNLYMKSCVECHQADGEGVKDTFPPLAGSEWTKGDKPTMLRIMLGGLMGPVTVKGVEWNSAMPGHFHASDEDLAAIASFVRYRFGGLREKPVEPSEIKALRPEVEARKFTPWTVKELPR